MIRMISMDIYCKKVEVVADGKNYIIASLEDVDVDSMIRDVGVDKVLKCISIKDAVNFYGESEIERQLNLDEILK